GTFPALLAVTVAAFGCARVVTGEPRWRRALDAMGMLTLAYLTATVLEGPALVLAWAAEAVALARVAQAVRAEVAPRAGGAGLGVRQQGQVALSALWALSGLGLLVCGLARGLRPARLGGLALLTIAMAKVFLFDLSTLDALNRVLSFVGLGLLLLVGAYAYG